MKIYWTFILVGVGFISMHTLPGFYIYTPPIHQYPSRNLHFPFFSFLRVFSFHCQYFISQLPSFPGPYLPLLEMLYHFYLLRVLLPSFLRMIFPSNPVVFESSSTMFQFSNIPVLYSSKAAFSIPFIPVSVLLGEGPCLGPFFVSEFFQTSSRRNLKIVYFDTRGQNGDRKSVV